MLRVVVTVVLATAVVATSLPAVRTAQHERSAARIEGGLDRLETAVADLRAREQVAASGRGARRVVTVLVPDRDWTHAGVAYVAVGGRPGAEGTAQDGVAFAWRLAGGSRHVRRLPGIRVEGGPRARDGPLVLAEPGRHRLSVRLVRRDGERVVVVRRLD